MILISYNKYYTPVCDCCGNTLDDEYDFDDAVAAIHAAGWSSNKASGVWVDYCSECAADNVRGEFDE